MPSYAEYLKIDELLALQRPLSEGRNTTMLFIVIHQVTSSGSRRFFTSWTTSTHAVAKRWRRARHTLRRILTILKVIVAQLDILETITPHSSRFSNTCVCVLRR